MRSAGADGGKVVRLEAGPPTRPPRGRGRRDPGSSSRPRERYATFTVDVLLAGRSGVRRTRASHIQGGASEEWPGWDPGRLLGFLEGCARLRPPRKAPAPPVPSTEGAPAVAPAPEGGGAAPPAGAGAIRLRDLQVVSESGQPLSIVPAGQAMAVRLCADCREVRPAGQPVRYRLTVRAKLLGGPPRIIADAVEDDRAGDSRTLVLPASMLPPGLYRLEALAALGSGEIDLDGRAASALVGGLVQVA